MRDFLRYARPIILPLLLATLFVAQNEIFNYWIGLWPNHFELLSVVTIFALGMLLFGPAVLFKSDVYYAYLFAMSVVTSLVLVAQYLYHDYFSAFLQASALRYARQLGNEGGTITALLNVRLLVFALGIPLVLACYAYFHHKRNMHFGLRKRDRLAIFAAEMLVVILGYGYLLTADHALAKLKEPSLTLRDLNRYSWSPDEEVQKVGVVNYYLADIIGSSLRTFEVTPEDVALVNGWAVKRMNAESRYSGVAKGRNLILIQVESLENSVIEKKIGGAEITPNLNRILKDGLYFNNYYTQIGPGNTADAEFVTQNSLYPLSNTVAFIDYAGNTYDALPETLAKEGYHTYVLHDDAPAFWNRANIYPALGYQTIIAKDDYHPEGELIMQGVGDEAFLRQSAAMIRNFDRPFMATVITLSSHTPFDIPEDLRTLDIPADADLTTREHDYLTSVHYADRAVGDFIAMLKEEDIYDDSVIVIFGDHGSFTGISGKLDTEAEKAHMLDDLRTNQVPLIILAPHTALRGVNDAPGSHLDLYPTIANLLGVDPGTHIFGQDLLNTDTPVEVHMDPDADFIRSILTRGLAYSALREGTFEEGTCFKMPGKTPLPIDDCRVIYDEASRSTMASEIAVRGNLITFLSSGAASSSAH